MIFDDNPQVQDALEKVKESRGGKVVTLLLLGIIVLLAAVYALLYGLAGDRMPRGVSVEGVELGGLHPAAAESKLRTALEPRSTDQIVLTHEGVKQVLTPEAAGLSVDYAASVEEAGGRRSLSPGRLWDYYTGGDKHEAVLNVDQDKMGAAVSSLSKAFGKPTVEGTIQFTDGVAKPVYSEPGTVLDPVRGRKAIEDQYLHHGSAEVRLTNDDPYISDEAVDTALREFAKPAMSGPVTLVLGGQKVVAPPKLFGQALSMIPSDRRLEGVVNGKKLLKVLEPVMTTVGTKPADASFKVVGGKPQVVPAKVGATFNIEDLEAKFPQVVVEADGKRQIAIQAAVVQPKFTTADAQKLGIKQQVSTFTTHFPYAAYRNVNLSRAAQLINGTVLKPGETFSLNGIVGERTAKNGFTEGFIIKDGLFRKDLGGGVSQIATTTFNAMFFAGLEDVEHKPHSVYISRYPEGREATVAWPSLDLRFKNTTPYGVLITAHVDKAGPGRPGAATVTMYSTKHWDITSRKGPRTDYTAAPTRYLDAPDCESSSGGPGFQVDVFRDFRKVGSKAVVRTEKFHTVYNPEPRLICGKPPAPSPTPSATPDE